MGRPKKGELIYRKSLKKNGYRQLIKAESKPVMANSGRSSLSTDYEAEDEIASDEAFDTLSSQNQSMHVNHPQLNNQLQQAHQHPQHLPQGHQQDQLPPQQDQQGNFSLGSLLHDCMTVEDWEDKPEMVVTSHVPQSNASHPSVMTSVVGVNRRLEADEARISVSESHTPTHSDLSNIHLQHSQHQLHHHQLQAPPQQASNMQLFTHIQENPPDPRQHQGQALHMSLARLLTPYQGKECKQEDVAADVNPMANVDNVHEGELPVIRSVKVEDSEMVNGSGVPFSDGAIIDSMQTLQALSKVDFQNYNLQGMDTTASFANGEHNSVSVPSVTGTSVPICQLEPSVLTVNINQHNVIYAQADSDTHGHSSNHSNLAHERTNITQLGNGRSSVIIETSLRPSVMDISQKQENANGSHEHFISSQGNLGIGVTPANVTPPPNCELPVRSLAHQPTSFRNVNGVLLQQSPATPKNIISHPSGNVTPVKNSLHNTSNPQSGRSTPRDSSMPSNVQPNNIISQAMAIASRSLGDLDGQMGNIFIVQGMKDPVSNMMQEQSQTIHTSQFSGHGASNTGVMHEALVSQQSTDRSTPKESQLINSQNRPEMIFDRPQRLENYKSPSVDLQDKERLISVNRLTPPTPVQDNSSPCNTQEEYNIGQRYCPNQNSPARSSPETDNQNQRFPNNATTFSNGDAHNTDSPPGVYLRKTHLAADSKTAVQHEINVNETPCLTGDFSNTVVLHGINRIFLGIDNTCEAFGCKHQGRTHKDSFRSRSFLDKMSPDEFLPDLSHMYWHSLWPSCNFVPTTPARKRVIVEVLTAFDNLQKTYASGGPEFEEQIPPSDQWEQWQLVQRKIARHVVAGQRFCRNIPGYFKLDIQDRISLGKHAGFGLMVLLACTEFYDPEFKRFRFIWNVTMPSHHPLFCYKVHLLSLSNRMQELSMDRTEAALLCAISMTSIDCPGIQTPTTVCAVRDILIDALEAHVSAKTDSTERVENLLASMPHVRHMTVWYNNLMKKMSLPTEVITNKMGKVRGSQAPGSENKPKN